MIKRILLICCIALASQAQRPLRWTADAATTASVTFDCSRGETLTFSPVLKAYGVTLTNYTASFLWQTNGMDTLFWSTNALVFNPSMDVGANRYRFFIRAETTNGIIYSAQGNINMLHGPGEIVNGLPYPVKSVDFATTVYTNAPWLLAETDPGIPAAIDSAVAQAGTNAQLMANAAKDTAVAIAGTNAQLMANAAKDTAVAQAGTNAQLMANAAEANAIAQAGTNATAALAAKISTNDVTYLDTVSKAATAYGWGDHSLAGYLGTSTWASWLSTNNYVKSSDTNGWTVVTHDGLATTNQLADYLPLAGGRVSGVLGVGSVTIDPLGPKLQNYGGASFEFDEAKTIILGQLIYAEDLLQNPKNLLLNLFGGNTLIGYYDNWDPSNTNKLQVNGSVFATMFRGDGSELTGITAGQVGAYGANNPSNLTTIAEVRAMTHTNQTWAAAGTNATYRMSWDITNGTFRVEEILP